LKTIWITGAGGLIGNYLVQTAPLWPSGEAPDSLADRMPVAAAPAAKVIGLTRSMLDLTDFHAVRAEFRRQQPRLVIHCAALSQSPACQADPALARKSNVEATAVLSELAANIPFFFLSTDLVFDGRTGNYDESAPVNPLSIYAETKVAAERLVLANPRHTVIRLSLNGGTSPSGNRGFNEQMRQAWKAGQTLRLFTDEFRSPTPAGITARAMWELAAQDAPGLYHLAGSERLSRWQLGQLLAQRWPQLNPKIEAASLRQYAGAPRSPDTSLNCAKVQRLLSFRLPGLSEWLTAHSAELF
jgi:dTDP-4-dehydrorhamnose reductase